MIRAVCWSSPRLYARADILDYWVIDLVNRQIIVHRQPIQGSYQPVAVHGEREPAGLLEPAGTMICFRDLTGAA